jgi:glycosyltransferase involved in cell wall biosynthesis
MTRSQNMHTLSSAGEASNKDCRNPREGEKRLLYLAEAFPPASIIGAVRAWNTVKQLSLLGWDVTVVTPSPRFWQRRENGIDIENVLNQLGVTRIETGHAFRFLTNGLFTGPKSKTMRLAQGVLRRGARAAGVDPDIGWALSVLRGQKAILARGYDVILATGSPFNSFWLARYFGRKLECPYVLDYRDPWHGNPHFEEITNSWGERLELKLLRDAGGITVVSESWAKLIADQSGFDGKIHVVTNGFDPDLYEEIHPVQFDHFAMVYAGVLYPPKRTLDPVLKALAYFADGRRSSTRQVRLHFYGWDSPSVQERARKFGCESLLEVHAEVSRKEALSVVKGADLSIVVTSVFPSSGLADDGIVTGKIFDCVGLRRPVLAVAPRQSDLRGIVAKSGLGGCFEGDEVDAIANFIGDMEGGRVPPPKDPHLFSWSTLGREMDRILSNVAGK